MSDRPSQPYTLLEASLIAGQATRTLRRAIELGRLVASKPERSRRWEVTSDALAAYIEKRAAPPISTEVRPPLMQRDADGWVSSLGISNVLRLPTGPAINAMKARLAFETSSATYRKVRQGSRAWAEYRLTDDQWSQLLDLAAESEVLHAYEGTDGWIATDIIDEEGPQPLRLYFLRENSRSAHAWHWRRPDGWASLDVSSMVEAIDQLTGDHPIRLSFQPFGTRMT